MRRLVGLVIIAVLLVAWVVDSPGSFGLSTSTLFRLAAPITNWFASHSSNAGQASVQSVIQRGNQEQEQAFAQNNPALMQDTATRAYYAQLKQTNSQLRAGGVTAIHLDGLMWLGSVTVQGGQAQATTMEMWTTTFRDSTTNRSTDENVYTLVQESGSWKISADNHPGVEIPAPYPVQPVVPMPGAQPQSLNWAGYQSASGTYTGVGASWTVPSAAPGTGSNAAWVGIGGVRAHDLIQAGTSATGVSGGVQYNAWVEMLPKVSHNVALTIHAGDSVSVAITSSGSNQWHIAIKDNTTGQGYQSSVTYQSSESSAEWIEEAPSSQQGLLPLDNFGTIHFSAAYALKGGKKETIAQAGGQSITMINARGQALANTTSLGKDGASFSVTRTNIPSTGGRPGAGSQPSPFRPGLADLERIGTH
ncbi:MAG TPA: G1 family glutamic endopeptidase [Chloroflexota bacterium]|nr:G1 family glutamic endopeptidase [Chloroflexota bacterium]